MELKHKEFSRSSELQFDHDYTGFEVLYIPILNLLSKRVIFMEIGENILNTIGNISLIKLNIVVLLNHARILVKLEWEGRLMSHGRINDPSQLLQAP